MMYKQIYETRIGNICIAEKDNAIFALMINSPGPHCEIKETKPIKQAYLQLKEYLQGKRKSFDLTLDPNGTDFQKNVWSELLKIPYGETMTYKELAEKIGNPKACRAVGMANNKNPIPIFIPCHRVIGSNGTLTGFAFGLELKKYLLEMEAKQIDI